MVSQIITFIVRMLLHLWLVLHLRLIIAFMGDTKGLKGQLLFGSNFQKCRWTNI